MLLTICISIYPSMCSPPSFELFFSLCFFQLLFEQFANQPGRIGRQQLFSLIQGIFDVQEQRMKNDRMKTLYDRERKLLDQRSEDYEVYQQQQRGQQQQQQQQQQRQQQQQQERHDVKMHKPSIDYTEDNNNTIDNSYVTPGSNSSSSGTNNSNRGSNSNSNSGSGSMTGNSLLHSLTSMYNKNIANNINIINHNNKLRHPVPTLLPDQPPTTSSSVSSSQPLSQQLQQQVQP